MKKVLSILIFVVFAICLLTACNNVELSLTFDANGGAFENGEETIEVTTDGVSKVSVPKNPSKDGYEFKGWFWDNETFNKPFTANSLLDEPIQSDMTVYAKWELEEGQSQEPVTYTITFNTNGGNDISPLTIENGTTIEIPNAPTREGHSFVGWYLDNSTFDQSANDILTGEITNDITVYAKWEINTYTVTFNGNGGTLTSGEETQTIEYGSSAIAPVYEKEGYTLSWDSEFSNITDDITVNAVWNIKTFTVTFKDWDESILKTEQVEYGNSATAPESPTREATAQYTYTFDGWDTAFDNITEVIIVTAQYKETVNTYTVTFNGNGGTLTSGEETQTIEYGSSAIAPVYEKEGYTLSWDSEFSNITEDITVNAVWTINQYTITFVSNGGSDVAEITQNYGTSLITPAEPTKLGYIFDGWYIDDGTFQNEYTFTTMPAESITIYAKWIEDEEQPDTYTISFESNGGSDVEAIIEEAGASINAPTEPTKTGYIFDGWYIDDGTFQNEYTFTTMPVESITLYAKWVNQVNTLEQMYISNNGLFSEIWGDTAPSLSYSTIEDFENDSGMTSMQLFNTNAIVSVVTIGDSEIPIAFEVIGNTNEVLQDMQSSTFQGFINELGCDIVVQDNIIFIDFFSINYILNGDAELSLQGDTYTNSQGNSLIRYIGSANEYTVSDTVTKIGSSAFMEREDIENVTLPDSVTSISAYAFSNCDSLENITIPNSVTSIGDYAFLSCDSLTSITIPDSVTSIGSGAFENCISLTSITIPDSATSIGHFAFYNCNNLTSITIPDSVTSIGNSAFQNCTSLTSITIPSSVISIGSYAFCSCDSLTIYAEAISKPSGWDEYWNPDNRLVVWGYTGQDVTYSFVTNGGTVVNDINAIYIDEAPITTKDGHTFVGWYDNADCLGSAVEFPYYSSTSVTLYAKWSQNILEQMYNLNIELFSDIWGRDVNGNNLEYCTIEDFENDFGITAMELFNTNAIVSVVTIGDSEFNIPIAFEVIGDTNEVLQDMQSSIYFLQFFDGSGIETIIQDNIIFLDYMSLNYILNGDAKLNSQEDAYIDSQGTVLIKYIGSANEYTVSDTVTKIGSGAFMEREDIENVTLPDSVTSIGIGAFFGCSSLTSINFGENSQLTTIGVEAFYNCESLTSITIPDSVTSIGSSAFSDCSSLTSITIPDSVTSIGIMAFERCTGLTSITFGENSQLTSIGSEAFSYCSSLTSITIPDSVTSIGSWAFSSCSSLTIITIPDSVTSIGSFAFSGCISLTSIIIPESVTNIGSFAFSGCISLTSIKVHNNNQYYKDINGVLYNKEGTRLIQYAIGKEDESFIVPDDIKIIDKFAFSGCYSLTSITFGENSQLTSIGEDAFNNCRNLTSITFGDNSQLITIGDYAFAFCNNLTSIAIPDSVISIGSYAFRSCSSLTSIIIPDTVISIGNNAFSGCNNIIICVETTNKLDSWNDSWNPDNRPVYWGYTGEEVTYNFDTNGGSQVENILATFLEAKPITTKDGKYFGGWYDNPELEGERISFPYYSSVDVTLYAQWLDPNQCNLEILWEQNKELISEVSNIDIENFSLQGTNIFEIGINSLVMNNVIPIAIEFESESEINENIQFCNEIFSVIFVFGVEDEIVPLFKRIEGTKIIFLSYSFQLDYLLFGNVIFDNDAYYDKEYKILLKYTGSDSEIKLLESITAIGSQAFSGCNDITSVIIPDSVTSIGAGAFTDCSSLESIKIPDSVTCIGAGAFTGCSSLESITIPNGTTSIGSYAFVGCYALTVYSEVSSAPNGWGKYWNRYNDDYNDEYDDYYRPVIWNCILSQDKTYVVSIDKNNIDNPDSYVLNNPYREGYIFDGWYTEDDFSGTKYDTIESAPTGTIYAKWTEVV